MAVLGRSAIFVFWEQSSFNSNQGVFGLMAKHLIEGRAFPVFMYGQNYMLAVESWVAAPLFLISPSVPMLKLPLLAMNLAVGLLLVRLLVQDGALTPGRALVAAIFFVVPSPGTAARLLEPSGGIGQPFLYIEVLWMDRHPPVWFGLVLGLGATHREFTLYGFVSILALEVFHRRLWNRKAIVGLAVAIALAAGVWLSFQRLALYSSAMGPGTSFQDLPDDEGQTIELAQRFCFDAATLPEAGSRILTYHWPMLFGTHVEPLATFGIESGVVQGLPYLGAVLAGAMLIAVGRIVVCDRQRPASARPDFPAYLLMVGVLSVTAYGVGRCGLIRLESMRYDMLSILGAVGIAAWYLRVETFAWVRTLWLVLMLMWVGTTVASHGRLWREYLRHPPLGGREELIQALDAHDVHYVFGTYRDAYALAFLTRERVRVSSADRVRISEYERAVRAHRDAAIRVQSKSCAGGRQVRPRIFFCPP
jgi:hypothetical protein